MNSELSHPVTVHFSSKKLVNISHQPKTDNETNLHSRSRRKSVSNSGNSKFLSPLADLKGQIPGHQCNESSKLKWKLGKTEGNSVRPGALPEISEHRASSGWVPRVSMKRSEPSRSSKIPFKELIPIKQISKEDRLQNFKRIRDEFRQVVNASNFLSVHNKESVFRAYIEKGNNGILIKQLMKKRWWWHLVDQPEKANLIWTEWFNKNAVLLMEEPQGPKGSAASFSPPVFGDEPRVTSIRKILDPETFNRIKARISLREQHYFRAKNSRVQSQETKQRQSLGTDIIHNHVQGCLQLHSKKLLFKNMVEHLKAKGLQPFEIMPITYYIDDEESPALSQLIQHCDYFADVQGTKNMWIVKPGQNSNRGYGISVHSGKQSLKNQIYKRLKEGRSSMIIQKYMEDCCLIENRKFDIRCYILITTVNGMLKGYWYQDGYIRTSSCEYSLTDVNNLMIHLTNDAVQKNNQSYGKFEDFNKLSFEGFRRYLRRNGFQAWTFDKSYEQMKNIAHHLIASTSDKIKRKQYTFELFGLDFMLDRQFRPYLIEANSNPCLDNSGIILGKLIYELVDNVLMTAVDPLFPAPRKGRAKQYLSKDYFRSNKFELIYSDSFR